MLSRLRRVKQWQTFTRTWWSCDIRWQDPSDSGLLIFRNLSGNNRFIRQPDPDSGDNAVVAKAIHVQLPNNQIRYPLGIPNDGVNKELETLDPLSDASEVDPEFIESMTPGWKQSFNLASYVNKSRTLQTFLSMGVSLFDIESISRKNAIYFLSLDFDRDCAKHVRFLIDNGLKTNRLGWFFSENPVIFKESLEDLQVRINYLKSKKFTRSMIAQMINNSALIWSHNTKTIDHKLGLLQTEFQLPGEYVRRIVTKYPTAILLPHGQMYLIRFIFQQEYGFDKSQLHKLLLAEPSILESERSEMFHRFHLIHSEMEFSLDMFVSFPKLFTCPIMDVRWRYQYLKKLNRAQFNPKLPLYVPPNALYDCEDDVFCRKYAKTNTEDYKLFLKSV